MHPFFSSDASVGLFWWMCGCGALRDSLPLLVSSWYSVTNFLYSSSVTHLMCACGALRYSIHALKIKMPSIRRSVTRNNLLCLISGCLCVTCLKALIYLWVREEWDRGVSPYRASTVLKVVCASVSPDTLSHTILCPHHHLWKRTYNNYIITKGIVLAHIQVSLQL